MKIIQNLKKYYKDYLIGVFAVLFIFTIIGNMNTGMNYNSIGYESVDSMSYDKSVGMSAQYDRGYVSNDGFAPEEENRKRIKNANVNIESQNYQNDKIVILNVINGVDAIILSESENYNEYSEIRTMYMTAKVDAKSLDMLLDQIKVLGEVKSLNVYVNDVTGTYLDYTQRVERYQSQIVKYEAMLDKPNLEINDEINIQNRIDNLENSIFYHMKYIGNIDEKVEYSDIKITLQEKPSMLAEIDFLGFRDGFAMFMSSIKQAIQTILMLFGFVLPFMILYVVYRLIKIPFNK